MERVVVTGMGLASPLGCSVAEFWAGLLEGRSWVAALTDEEFVGLRTRIGARVTGFDEQAHFSRKEARRMSRSSQLALVAAAQAVSDARLTLSSVDPVEVGVVIGSSIGGFSASDPVFRDYYRHGRANPLVIPISMNSGPASNISIRYGFQGPLMSVDAACASAAHSIGYAFHLIRSGTLEVAVAGGTDCPFSRGVMQAWCELRALSERNDTPAEACRPFSADRDGLVLGEGAGVLILESESSALRRGSHILGEIKGYGATGDSYHLTQPTQGGPARAMRKALNDAALTPKQVAYINAHATGTPYNDKNETAAIKEVFADHAYKIPVVGNKAALGHSIAASGALELISCILSIRDQAVPPTINYRVPDPECDLDYVIDGKRSCPIAYAMSNSFAFGGSNAAIVVGQYHSEP
ncbi:MAG: beta-ketoacyl-[acyl-carrier-protein] synthase family protein [Chloroflexi bacterium]|nr:beta-ketoacyl-[acyl-carrier-protein] synthase family protein [Chloroflexota bacterium]